MTLLRTDRNRYRGTTLNCRVDCSARSAEAYFRWLVREGRMRQRAMYRARATQGGQDG